MSSIIPGALRTSAMLSIVEAPTAYKTLVTRASTLLNAIISQDLQEVRELIPWVHRLCVEEGKIDGRKTHIVGFFSDDRTLTRVVFKGFGATYWEPDVIDKAAAFLQGKEIDPHDVAIEKDALRTVLSFAFVRAKEIKQQYPHAFGKAEDEVYARAHESVIEGLGRLKLPGFLMNRDEIQGASLTLRDCPQIGKPLERCD